MSLDTHPYFVMDYREQYNCFTQLIIFQMLETSSCICPSSQLNISRHFNFYLDFSKMGQFSDISRDKAKNYFPEISLPDILLPAGEEDPSIEPVVGRADPATSQ